MVVASGTQNTFMNSSHRRDPSSVVTVITCDTKTDLCLPKEEDFYRGTKRNPGNNLRT